MFFNELKRSDKTQSLLNWTANGKVVDSYLANYSVRVNDEQTSIHTKVKLICTQVSFILATAEKNLDTVGPAAAA